jgi:hypothetical protein
MFVHSLGASRRENANSCLMNTNARHIFNRHHPRMRVIQYSRAVGDGIERARRTGYPACAGYDGRRAGKGALAPRPPSICGVILNGGHAEFIIGRMRGDLSAGNDGVRL